jgi:Spy/CpxP family protein refolding chaperone
MKAIAILTFALALAPGIAFAQTAPAAPPDGPGPAGPGPAGMSRPHPDFAQMQQLRKQMMQIRQQARQQMLGALSPAHRKLLADVVGQLAVAPNPDRKAAVQTLDAALSPSESQAILAAESSARTQSRSLMETARAKFEASLTPDQKAAMAARAANRPKWRPDDRGPGPDRGHRTPDAGRTLLEVALGHGDGPGMRGPGMRGPGGPGGPGMGGPPPPAQ